MPTKYAIRKCTRCCPDGGAICDRTTDIDGKPQWECRNCGCEMPRRIAKPSDKPSTTQARRLAKLVELFGDATVIEKQEMMGTKLWVTLRNDVRKWFNGNLCYGTIGRNGKLKLTLAKMFGDSKINDMIGANVYLKE